jgi:hypothetical protein
MGEAVIGHDAGSVQDEAVVCCRSRRPCAVTTPGFHGSGSLTSITQRWKTAVASLKTKSTVPEMMQLR